MAARKLQTEIDRTLKKVSEGVELFESIYDKMQASTNQTQKEKLELDLKTQIKKLQRLRDQIKTWITSNDIKDKSALVENRKLIETQMEKFKACEKEMKTKAFSKEGLTQAARLDPKEQEKEEATQWLNSQVEELQMQVEQAEAEIEGLQGTGKKRNKGGNSGRAEELEQLNERRKWHISRLEIVLRLLSNGSLSADRVFALKEDVQYFVESNTEEEFEEDEGIYDELNLDEEEEKFGITNDDIETDESDDASEDIPPRTPARKQHDEESVASSKRDERDSPILKKATVNVGGLRKQSVEAAKPPPNLSFSQQPMSSVVKAGLPPAKPVQMPPIRYAAAAAAAVSSPAAPKEHSPIQVSSQPSKESPVTPPAPSLPPQAPPAPSTISTEQQSAASSSPSLTHPSVTSPMLSSASTSQQPDGSFYSGQESPALSEAVQKEVNGPIASSSSPQPPAPKEMVPSPSLAPAKPQPTEPQTQQSQQPPVTGPSPLPQPIQPIGGALASSGNSPMPSPIQPQFPPGVKAPQQTENVGVPTLASRPQSAASKQLPTSQPRTSAPSAFPGSLSDLVVSFENVKQKAAHRMTNLDQVHKMLDGSHASAPQPQDTDKPKYYVPKNPYQTPSYYPQSPHTALSTQAIFSQLDVETLFYVFYYLPGTYQQYLAAKELKRQSWRFHVKYLTWFQRHSEPQAITEEYEQGVYVYFDWEGSWCQRKKSDFRFEYRYLSED